MTNKIIYLTSEKNLGDSTNAEANAKSISKKLGVKEEELTKVNVLTKESNQLNLMELNDLIKKSKQDKVVITSAGEYGAEVLKEMLKNNELKSRLQSGNIRFVYSSHQLYDNMKDVFKNLEDKDIIKNLILCFPQHIEKNIKDCGQAVNLLFKNNIAYSLTVATANTKEKVEEESEKFQKLNPDVIKKIGTKLKLCYFLGGTATNADGTNTEFTEKEAERQAEIVFSKAKEKGLEEIVVFTHGYRTFRNPDKNDAKKKVREDFKPYNAFVKKMTELKENQGIKVHLFTKGSKIQESLLQTIGEEKTLKVDGNAYFYGLNLASEKENFSLITEEQISGCAELLEVGTQKFEVVDFGEVSNQEHKEHAKNISSFLKKGTPYISQSSVIAKKYADLFISKGRSL